MQNEEFVLLLLLTNKALSSVVTRYFRRNEGTTDYAQFAAPITLAGDFVIEFDVLTSATTGTHTVLGSSTADTKIQLIGSTGVIRVGDGTQVFSSLTPVNDSSLHTIRIVKAGPAYTFFTDGVADGSGTSAITMSFDMLYRQATSSYLSGILANLKIWDSGVLTHWLPIDDGGDTLVDKVGGNNATIINPSPEDWQQYTKQNTGEWLGQREYWVDDDVTLVNIGLATSTYDSATGVGRLVSPADDSRIRILGMGHAVGSTQRVKYTTADVVGKISITGEGTNLVRPDGDYTSDYTTVNTAFQFQRGTGTPTDITLSNISMREVLNVA